MLRQNSPKSGKSNTGLFLEVDQSCDVRSCSTSCAEAHSASPGNMTPYTLRPTRKASSVFVVAFVLSSLACCGANDIHTCPEAGFFAKLSAATDSPLSSVQALEPNAVPSHKIWRLNVPGSASSNLHEAILEGEKQSWQKRLQIDNHTEGDCEHELVLHGCDVETLQVEASFLRTARQSQHADYSHLDDRFIRRHMRNTFVHKDPVPNQKLLAMTMIRDPFAHFIRSYEKKSRHHGDSEVSFLFAPTWKERNSSELPDDLVPLSEYAHKAFWRWNVFSRSLAGNYTLGHILNGRAANDLISRDEAIGINTRALTGQSGVFSVARERLLKMKFFGIFERLSDSMELLAHSLCWDFEGLGFNLRDQSFKKEYKNLKTKPDGEPEDAVLTTEMIEQNNAADRLLYNFASQLFEERFQVMKADQENGIVCRFLDTGCYIQKVPRSPESVTKEDL